MGVGKKACWGVKVSGWSRKCSKGQWKGRANSRSEAIWRNPSNPNCRIEVSQREVKTGMCQQAVGFARQLLPIPVVARWGDLLSTPPPPPPPWKSARLIDDGSSPSFDGVSALWRCDGRVHLSTSLKLMNPASMMARKPLFRPPGFQPVNPAQLGLQVTTPKC